MKKIAVDFGTTNTVVAVWREALNAPETVGLPGLSVPFGDSADGLTPSVLYVSDGIKPEVVVGHSVFARGLDIQQDARFFSSFKRGVAASNRPLARVIDGEDWDEARTSTIFLSTILRTILEVEGDEIDELVLTVPIQSFERYLQWLRAEFDQGGRQAGFSFKQIRVVDESTAAALGYEVRTPGDLVLVLDFGGGTLDVSLVRMPLDDEESGFVLEAGRSSVEVSRARLETSAEARVVAKAGRVLGGDDIDHWLLDDILVRNSITRKQVGGAYGRLKQAAEAAKIRLSDHESAEISVFDPASNRTFQATVTRSQMEAILDQHEFFTMVQKTIDKAMRGARARGIFAEDISAVLLVGGTSRIPSVRRLVRTHFGAERVMEHKPFEAVAHGALSLAAGFGLDDFLYHSYGIRHLSALSGRHEWEELIPAGTRYPLPEPARIVLTASRDGQEALELVIGEVEDSTNGITEVMFGDHAILMVDGGIERKRVIALNDEEGARTVAYLDPPGKAGEDRVEVEFNVDKNRMLRVSVIDLATKRQLLRSVPVVELR